MICMEVGNAGYAGAISGLRQKAAQPNLQSYECEKQRRDGIIAHSSVTTADNACFHNIPNQSNLAVKH